MIDMYRGVATLNKLIIIDGDAEEVCNFAHIETIIYKIYDYMKKKLKLSICPHYHPTTRKKANYNI